MKMQNLLKNDKIQFLLKKRKSKDLIKRYSVTVEDKKDKIEKIKNLIKENKKDKNSKVIVNNMIQEIEGDVKIKAETMIHQDMNNQEENFKKRLEEKRSRGNSLPHIKLKSKLGANKINPNLQSDIKEEKIDENKNNEIIQDETIHTKDRMKTPTKKKSVLTISTFGTSPENKSTFNEYSDKHKLRKKSNFEMDLNQVKTNFNNIEEIFLNNIVEIEYEETIEKILLKLWEESEKLLLQQNDNTQIEIEKYLDKFSEEKFRKSIDVYSKYDKELKELQNDIDLSDPTNVNTIIYNEFLKEREDELNNLYNELEIKKNSDLNEIKNRKNFVNLNYEKMKEIGKIKSDISQHTKLKITQALQSDNNTCNITSMRKQSSRASNRSSDSYDGDVIFDNISYRKNSNKKEKDSNTNKVVRSPQISTRISRGSLTKDSSIN